ncbi:winged helix-turn-helix domain-containing protein [Vibrio methylphosphonaticus]|uniref:winged helix-turn-helix domain-containing protein n=1 Tax=Vibrio methylphosphonaticus TaxID=2946866 RepID=UPI002029DDD6|nr:crosslink repair DNA glycosylase YcaQ family protein [Vibrio methylphosphonaticus]MCL9775787.1 winged helix DNA-binding domain-containing protein [Vibrio methylphosphonaticus]
MANSQALSMPEARKLVLLSQQLPSKQQKGTAHHATLSAIEHLGYVQIDTISVVQRAHHHTLWNRNRRYQPEHIDHLTKTRDIFEYWSHAAAYLPIRDYRFSLFRKLAFKEGRLRHWYRDDRELMQQVHERIRTEGPLMAKDFSGARHSKKGWGSKPTKQALECLFMQGDLMVTARHNFHKVYDLTERVIPADSDVNVPSEYDYARFLVMQYLQANGLGRVSEMTYLLKGLNTAVSGVVDAMIEDGELLVVNVEGDRYVALSSALSLLNQPLSRAKAVILSPFDNCIIQRKRIKALFNFDYLLECYVPKQKRQFGYFCLPILWAGELVARVDCKVNKATEILEVLHLALELTLKETAVFMEALELELQQFARFNGCRTFKIVRITP